MKLWIFVFCSALSLAFDHSHAIYDQVLKNHVKLSTHSSTVNYKVLKSDRDDLDQYLKDISKVTKSQFQQMNEKQKLAMHINAYNAFTLKFVIDHYPIKSIKEIKSGFLPTTFNDPWKKLKFIYLEEEISLSQLEHGIIRAKFNEPRIHFAINCASIGCPALANFAYRADLLEKQLKQATAKFMNDRSRNYYDVEKKMLYLSKIFDWFRKDFQNKYGGVKLFALPYLLQDLSKVKELSENRKVKIDYTDYDWNLNEEL